MEISGLHSNYQSYRCSPLIKIQQLIEPGLGNYRMVSNVSAVMIVSDPFSVSSASRTFGKVLATYVLRAEW